MLISPALDREAEAKDLKTLDSMSRKPLFSGLMWWLTYAMMESVFKPYFDDAALLKEVTAEAKRIPRPVGRSVLIGYFDHLDEHGDLAARLAATKRPVFYVRGEKDDIGFTPAHRETLAKCETLSLREIPGARHFAMVDKPAEVASLIVELAKS
jgi:pimeloyl-ACP methyl ester carboxylesterase